jgi:aryl-alcohol dehydrogenase-like predicted oxidoreductase
MMAAAPFAARGVLARPAVTSVLIGASSLKQIQENVVTLEKTHITPEELAAIDAACSL